MKRRYLFNFLPYRFARLVAPLIAAWPMASFAAPMDWEGLTGGTPGDGINWSQTLNWQGDTLPLATDDVLFGAVGTGGSLVHLNSTRTVNALSFDENTTLGAYGTSLGLVNTTGNISVASGVFAQMNARLSTGGNYTLSGGGSLFMNNTLAAVPGNWTVNGSGTSLVFAYPGQVNPPSRSDAPSLGLGNRTITLTDGGEFKLVGSSFNPDGTVKAITLGAGGGKINVAAGFQTYTIDDAAQIAGSGLTKTGNGRLTLGNTSYAIGGANAINGGVVLIQDIASDTAGDRFTAFAAGATLNVSGGGLVLAGRNNGNNAGLVGVFDNALTLGATGVLAVEGADGEFGVRTGTATTLTLNGGTILARDSSNPQSSGRLPRINSQILGSGVVDVVGGASNGGNARIVLQRGDAGSTFNGTWVLHGNTALENTTRNGGVVNTGNAMGSGATIELRGHNPTLDVRDNGVGANGNLAAYAGNTIAVTGEDNSIGRVSVQWMTANLGNVFQFGNFKTGENRTYFTNNGTNGASGLRFSGTTTFTGATAVTPTLDLNLATGTGRLEFNSGFSEHMSGDGLRIQGRQGIVDISGGVNLSSVELRGRETRLFGANGSIGLGSLSGASSLTISGGRASTGANAGSTGTVLHLNNNLANTGASVTAATNNNRLNDLVPINILGDATLRLTTQSGVSVAETTGNLSVVGRPTIDTIKVGTLTSAASLTLGSSAAANFANGAGLNFSGTNLGSTSADSTRIFLNGQSATGFMGNNFTSGNEWVKYTATEGVVPFAAADYNIITTPYTSPLPTTDHVKLTTVGQALTANETVRTLNLQMPALSALNLGASNLVVTDGAINVGINGQAISGTTGTLTAGTSGTQNLQIHNSSTLDLTATLSDNAGGGAVTLVKNGEGTLRLVHQGTVINGGGSQGAPPLATPTHTNAHTGGLIINNGVVEVWRPEYLGTGTVTINGGALALNNPVMPSTYTAGMATTNGGNNQVLNYGNNIVFNASGGLYADDNGESNDANAGGNAMTKFGSLTINGSHIVGFASYGNGGLGAGVSGGSGQDFIFNGASFNGTPTLNMTGFRSGGSVTGIEGALTGSGFRLEAMGDSAGVLQLGTGGADNVANTYSGTVYLTRTSGNGDPTLRLDKANGTTAVTGDIIINGGTLAWGTGAIGTNNSNVNAAGAVAVSGRSVVSANNQFANQWTGNSIATAFANTTSGNDQIADTANITLMFGTVNEGARVVNEKFNNFRQLNGNFNTGFGKIEVNSYTISGGAYSHNSGGTFAAGTMTLLSGAPDITVANNFAGTVSRLEVGAGGLNVNGQNIVLGNSDYFTPSAGSVLKLSGPLTVQADPLNFTNSDRQRGIISGLNGRELASNWVDLDGGNRSVTVADNIFYTINVGIQNGGLVKDGSGILAIQNTRANNFAGGLTVNNGIFIGRSADSAGSGAIDINAGGTVKIDGGWTWANNITLSGAGAPTPQGGGVMELGALVSEVGHNVLTGTVTIDGGATIASNLTGIPSTANTSAGGGVAAAGALIKSNLIIRQAVTGTGGLTLTGNGNGTLLSGVQTTGSLTKSGAGTWSIGASTFPGVLNVDAGTLRATTGTSLGSTAGSTNVRGGATLAFDGNLISAETININGSGWENKAGAIASQGRVQLSGAVTAASDSTVRSNAGTLALSGSLNSTNAKVTLAGAGTGNVTGATSLAAASGDALVKSGTGSWTLAGTNTITGGTRVEGGKLSLNGGLDSASALTLAGGSLTNTGTAQTVAGLNLTAGGGTLNGGAGLALGNINRNVNANVNFDGTVSTTTPNNADNVLGGYATVGTDWAVGGGPVSAFSSYTPLVNDTGTLAAGEHGLVDYDSAGYAYAVHTGTLAGATLKVNAGLQGLQLGTVALDLTSNGLLIDAGAGNVFNLGGTGTVGTSTSDLNIHVTSGAAYISNPLLGAGAGTLNKAGDGELRLFGSSSFTGGVNVNGGTLSVVGQTNVPGALGGSLTNANRVITLNGGTFSLAGGDFDLNDYDTVTAGVQSLQFNVGPAGGTFHSANGTLLLNDAGQLGGTGQLMGSGDLKITGAGRVSINNSFPLFTGDITVDGGVLSMQNGVGNGPGTGGNQLESQTVTLNNNTAMLLGADLAQKVNFNGNTQLSMFGSDRAFKSAVTINGTLNVVMAERDAVGTARSLGFYGAVNGSGTINISGASSNGRVQFAGGSSDFTGTVNVGTNASIEIREPGSFGTATASPTVNLAGESRSRLLLRGYQGGEYHLDVNATGNYAEIYSGRIDNYGSTFNSQGLFKINSLKLGADAKYLTLTGDNNNWTAVKSPVTAVSDSVIVTNSNATFMAGGSFAGNLDKRGGSLLALEGATTVAGKTVIQQGWIDVRGAGTLSTTGIELRGGNLLISNNVAEGSDANRIAGVPITLGGGSLRVVGTTNLGTLTAAPGATELNYAMDTQSGIAPLVINDMSSTRAIGSHIRLASTYGTIGAPTSNQTFPRIWVGATGTGLADNFGNGLAGNVDIIPWMVMANEFVAYRSTLDAGVPLGYVQVANGSMRTDAADGTGADQLRSATASTEIMRFTAAITTTLAGNATWRAIKMDGGTGRTIALGANTLTVDRGAIIHVANDQRIGEATGTGFLQSGNNELQATVNAGTLVIGAVFKDGPAGTTHLVKNGGGTLRFDGANANTFTGNIHLNAGVFVNNNANHVPTTATINFNGGRWEPNVTAAGPNADIAMGNNIVVNATASGIAGAPALSMDNGTGGQDNNYNFGSVTINNGVEWSIAGWDGTDGNFNATGVNPHVFNGTPTIQLFQGRTGAATNEGVMTFAGPITGSGFHVQSIGTVAGTTPSNTTLNIGGGATDTLPNTYTGDFTTLGNGATASLPIVRLNKAPSVNAISGNVILNAGQLQNLASEQIANTANVRINGDPSGSNQMTWSLNGQTESINDLTINGGGVTTGVGTLNVLGNLTVNMGSQVDNLQINSAGGRVNVTGTTTVNDFGRIVVGGDNAALDLSGPLNMTGGTIQLNSGTGSNILRLRDDITATSSLSTAARIANIDDSDTFVQLHGLRQFTVNDGPQGNDLIISGTIANSTAPGAPTSSGIYKAGAGTMVIAGTAATPNTFNGDVTVSSGELHLAKAAGQNAFASADVYVGDGNGPAKLVLRNSNQIPDGTSLTIDSQGVLDLQSFNTSETVGNLGSVTGAETRLGPSSTLGVNITTNVEYAGSIHGGGATTAISKNGAGKWTLSGNSEYAGNTDVLAGTLEVNGFINGSKINIMGGATLSGTGFTSDVFISSGATISPGNSPGVLTTRNLTLADGSTSIMEIGGLTPGNGAANHDQIASTGSVSLDGTLVISLVNGYVPNQGDQFTFISSIGPILSDFDSWTTTVAETPVDTTDYWTVSKNGTNTAYIVTYIPEPSTASFAGLLALAALAYRRRKSA